jgi:hypothetical protein
LERGSCARGTTEQAERGRGSEETSRKRNWCLGEQKKEKEVTRCEVESGKRYMGNIEKEEGVQGRQIEE